MVDREWIGETFTSATGWNLLEELVDVGDRMAGSDGERRGLESTRDALERVGATDAKIETFPIQGWTRGESSLEAGDTTQECIALPRGPAGDVGGPLVDVGYGLPGDFDRDLSGAVAMAGTGVPDWYDRRIHRREKYYRAVEAGAAAFVYRNDAEGCLAPTGSVGHPEEGIGPVPAVGVSREVGARLSRRFEGRDVRVRVDCEAGDAESGNVHARLGPDTDREVLVTCHVDAHDVAEGAMDNGAGTAALVEVAKALATRDPDPSVGVRFVAFGAEEVGLVGSSHAAERMDLQEVAAVLNLDGVVRGRTLALYTNGFEALDRVARRVSRRFDHPIETIPEVAPHSDHWPFVQRGVPGYHAMSKTGDAGRGWGHTRADTIDKLDSRTLRESAVLLTALTVELADRADDLERADPARIAERLRDRGLEDGMRVAGDWPYEG